MHPEQRPEVELPGSHGWVRVMIDGSLGARELVQRVFRFEPGHTPELHNEDSEDVMYVVSGRGVADLGGADVELMPGTACYVPPGVGYRIENDGPHDLVMLSVLSPPPGAEARSESTADQHVNGHPGPPRYWLHEDDQEVLPAGESRTFRVLVDPASGCRNVTQFVGTIEDVPAPPHVHTYEEAVHILGGDGTVEIDGEVHPIGPGSSVFLPPGVPHRLASAGGEALRLLGVFSPPGSPASKDDSSV